MQSPLLHDNGTLDRKSLGDLHMSSLSPTEDKTYLIARDALVTATVIAVKPVLKTLLLTIVNPLPHPERDSMSVLL